MDMSRLLKPESVRVVGNSTSKKRLFRDLAEIAHAAYGIDEDLALDSLQERESLGSTGVGHGVALPHARIEGISEVVGVFLKLERPCDYASVDKAPVDLIFALFAPREAGVDHLKALAYVSRTLRDSGVCAKLRANNDPATLHALLSSVAGVKAA
ncbi:MAG: PTS sugar transporter subunit IIA [Rhodobacteraceae bacterium]|nr:PTS sugar transporter subunit IIA [Paracoccaceae bacterium]